MCSRKNLLAIVTLLAVLSITLFVLPSVSLAQGPTATFTATKTSAASVPVTATVTLTPTATIVPPTATKTVTPVVPTATKTVTPVVPTATKTVTPVVPTATKPATAVAPTATKTVTAVVPTATKTVTPTVAATKTATPTKTNTPAPTPTKPRAAAPRAPAITSVSTSFVIQNTDPSITANTTASFYNSGGVSSTVNSTIAPYGNVTIDQRASGGGLDGFTNWQGAVVLSSNTSLAAMVNEYSGNAAAQGNAFRMDSYAGISSAAADYSVLLPQILKNVYDGGTASTYNSAIVIQNTDISLSATAVITYYNVATGAISGTHPSLVIPPGSSILVDLASEGMLPSLYYGAARVSADRKIGVLVQQNAGGVLNVYSGFTSANAQSTLYVPQVVKNVYDSGTQYNYQSSIIVMSADLSPANVTVTYFWFDGAAYGSSVSSQNGQIASTFDLRYDPALSNKGLVFASARIDANKPVVAVVPFFADFNASRGLRSTYYSAFTYNPSQTRLFAPLVMKNSYDAGTGTNWSTGLTGQLLGGTAARVYIYYYDSNGSLLGSSYRDPTPSSPVFNFDTRYDTALNGLSSVKASAIMTSTQPFGFITQVFAESSAPGDASGSYLGMSQ